MAGRTYPMPAAAWSSFTPEVLAAFEREPELIDVVAQVAAAGDRVRSMQLQALRTLHAPVKRATGFSRKTAREFRMQRSTLDPAFAPAIESLFRATHRGWLAVFRHLGERPRHRIGDILEAHDPRRVSSLNDSIRTATEERTRDFFWQKRLYDGARWALLVQRIVAVDAGAAFALMTVNSGHTREAAVRAVTEVPGAFCLALMIYRLNDWVPEVRAATEEKLLSLNHELPDKTIADCYELLVDFKRFRRAGGVGRSIVERLISRAGVDKIIRESLLSGGHDRALQLLRLVLRSDHLDEDLERLATVAHHANVRTLAMRTLLEGRFYWKDRGALTSRPVSFTGSKDALARKALEDHSLRVKLAGLDHVIANLAGWTDPQESLVAFATHRSLPLAKRALYGLSAIGIDSLAVLRCRLNDPREPSLTVAILLARGGNPEDASSLFEAAQRLDGRSKLRFLSAPARLGHPGAIAALKDAALRGADLQLAKMAAKALKDADQWIGFDELVRIADRGQEFVDRGLMTFLFRIPVLAHVIVLCRLERAGADLELDRSYAFLQRKINRGRFAPKPSDWDAVVQELPGCPNVRERAEVKLAIDSRHRPGD
jgi:hypothetical protein